MDLKPGNKIGKWTLLEPAGKDKYYNKLYLCQCTCGLRKTVIITDLINNRSRSCIKCGNLPHLVENELPYFFWRSLKTNAKKRDIKIRISRGNAYKLFLQQNKTCNLTGLKIDFATSSVDHLKGNTTASLDRIDSLKPYVIGNLQWVHKDVNRMKNIFGQDRFIEICKLVATKHENA